LATKTRCTRSRCSLESRCPQTRMTFWYLLSTSSCSVWESPSCEAGEELAVEVLGFAALSWAAGKFAGRPATARMPAKRKLKSRLEIILAHSPQKTLTVDKVFVASKARLTGEM
jgi:hypothetical protein